MPSPCPTSTICTVNHISSAAATPPAVVVVVVVRDAPPAPDAARACFGNHPDLPFARRTCRQKGATPIPVTCTPGAMQTFEDALVAGRCRTLAQGCALSRTTNAWTAIQATRRIDVTTI